MNAPWLNRAAIGALVTATATLIGCCSAGTAKVVEALGHDTNNVRVVVTTVWGTVDVSRNAPAGK